MTTRPLARVHAVGRTLSREDAAKIGGGGDGGGDTLCVSPTEITHGDPPETIPDEKIIRDAQ